MTRARAKNIDWELVQVGKRKHAPDMTFSPGDERRGRWVECLTLPSKTSGFSKEAKLTLERWLGDHFALVYTRYRRQVQPSYGSPFGEERRHCVEAGRNCIILSVTPFNLVKFWHERIGHFTGMAYPPVSFVAKHSRVDEVASSMLADGSIRKSPPRRKSKSAHHAYSDTERLESGLRVGLTDAGFDLSGWNDRNLMSIQSTAESILEGHTDAFIPANMRAMVKWVVKNSKGRTR